MQDLQTRIVAILRTYMADKSATVDSATSLDGIGIDTLDLPMVLLDIEDITNVSLTYVDEIDGFANVADLVHHVAGRIEEKARKAAMPRPVRSKRGWMSTGDSRRR